MAKYKLYYSPGSCATAVHAILIAIGADFEIEKAAGKEYLELNPLGQVPVLVEDGKILRESGAIIIHLLDQAKHPLLPQDSEARVKTLQWLLFFNSTMHQTFGAYYLMQQNLKDDAVKTAALDLLFRRLRKLWRYVEDEITTEYIAGNEPTAADVLMAVIANWAKTITPALTLGDKTKNICGKIAGLPYFTKALQAEGVEYKI